MYIPILKYVQLCICLLQNVAFVTNSSLKLFNK